MSIFQHSVDHDDIIGKYFSDPEKKISLQKDDVLLEQGEINQKLFYINSGRLSGFLPDEHLSEPVLEAHEGSFLGVYSFFSEDHISYSRVIANEPSEVFYFDQKPDDMANSETLDLMGFLFNIVVLELRSRQHFAAQMANDRQEAMNKLIQTEKLITLGQLAAGLAHELNNTIGSLSSNLGQLESDVSQLITHTKAKNQHPFFQKGLEKGLTLTSNEEREIRRSWPKSLTTDASIIKKIIRAGIPSKEVKDIRKAEESATLWHIGHVLHDLKVASTQASHVVNSIKTMGIANQQWSESVYVNDTIREALVILKSITKHVDFEVDLDEAIQPIEACHGELVQVWVNLIKNSVENLRHHQVTNPTIKVLSLNKSKKIEIQVEDNGTGIDESILSKIYEPSFTTKVAGLSLGLGLGLTIVQRIITEHNGTISIKSKPGCTLFKISLPKR